MCTEKFISTRHGKGLAIKEKASKEKKTTEMGDHSKKLLILHF